ncbi:hypothetical protein LCGC14_2979050 [marine sediment metagenome]|uniref:Uncharacterized protein n=1 Tax=marine sediment metagenome TaxID=412755 RepID=A0A0F8X769_9ZZZZ
MTEKITIAWCKNCKAFHIKCTDCSTEISIKKEEIEKMLEKVK